MDSSKYITRIEELIGVRIVWIQEPDVMEAMSLEATFMVRISSEPVDPEEFHPLALT